MSPILKRDALWGLLLCLISVPSLSAQSEKPGASGYIVASPANIVVESGQLGTTNVSWSVSGASHGEVWVSHNGAPETPFAAGANGSVAAPWIQQGHTYLFKLYEGSSHTNLLASTAVAGIVPNGTITANPVTVGVPSGQTGSTVLTVQSNANVVQVWVSVNYQPETIVSQMFNGTLPINWIQAGNSYEFRLYAGTQQSQLLDTVTVTGVENPNITGTISANPSTMVIVPGQTGNVALSWTNSHQINTAIANIRYRVNDGPEMLLVHVYGNSGVVNWSQLQDGLTYEYRLYAGTTTQLLLATTTVTTISAYGFSDSRLMQAKARTEFRNSEIPFLTPNANSCEYVSPLYPLGNIINPYACDQITNVPFQATNEWAQNGGFSSNTYWVLGMNTEYNPWIFCNAGPPNMSEPNLGINFATGTANGRYGFQMRNDPADGFWRAHLFVDNRPLGPQAQCIDGEDLAPWLSIGAHEGFGNTTPVGVLNPTSPGSPTATRFTANMQYYDSSSTWADFYVYALTNWGGKNRGILLRIVHEGSANTGSNNDLDRVWNWPLEESLYYPGNDWAFFDANLVRSTCPNLIQEIPRIRPCDKNSEAHCNAGMDVEYIIDWQALFECASDRNLFQDPLPLNQTNIPIQGIHWAVENYGTTGTSAGSSLWMSVHDMRMVPSPQ